MLVDVVIPELGESITEGTITSWHAQVGERVEEDQPLLEVDTDKVSVDVPSPATGVLKEVLVEEGDVPVGEVVARIDTEAEAGAPAPEKAEKAEKAEKPKQPEKKEVEAPAPEKPAAAKAAPKPRPEGEGGGEGEAGPLSPGVRRLVEEHGVDASRIEGTGPHGRVLKEDVLPFLEGGEAGEGKAEPRLRDVSAKAEAPGGAGGGRPERRVKMTRLRRRIAERLKEVQNTAAILTTFNEIDMSAVMDARRRYKDLFEKRHGVRLGFMGFFVKATVEALKAFPAVNGFIEGEELVYHDYYDIGVAVSSDKGLVVPVLRGADRLSFAEIEKGIGELADKARKGTLTLDELSGGTFSITNGGVFGSLLSTPILNPPQSGILGMHAITQRPVAVDGKVEVRPVMFVALSYDHRIVDGREAVQFLVRIKEALEDPSRLLLEI